MHFKLTYLIDNPATVFFSIFMAIWTVLFIEFWKREQSKLQFEWDVTRLGKADEIIRPEFEMTVSTTNIRINPVTDKKEPYVPIDKKVRNYFVSVGTIFFMVI